MQFLLTSEELWVRGKGQRATATAGWSSFSICPQPALQNSWTPEQRLCFAAPFVLIFIFLLLFTVLTPTQQANLKKPQPTIKAIFISSSHSLKLVYFRELHWITLRCYLTCRVQCAKSLLLRHLSSKYLPFRKQSVCVMFRRRLENLRGELIYICHQFSQHIR